MTEHEYAVKVFMEVFKDEVDAKSKADNAEAWAEIERLKAKVDTATAAANKAKEETNKAKEETNKAKEETSKAREETNKAKEEAEKAQEEETATPDVEVPEFAEEAETGNDVAPDFIPEAEFASGSSAANDNEEQQNLLAQLQAKVSDHNKQADSIRSAASLANRVVW